MALCTRVGDAGLLQRRLHAERIHDGGQHAHVVGLGAVHAGRRAGDAAEDVAAADHHADLDAERDHAPHILGDAAAGLGVEAIIAVTHQCLAGHLEHDTLVAGRMAH